MHSAHRSARHQALAAVDKRPGAAAIEFVIVLPILVTVVLGMSDFGRLYYSAISITNAARAGAAYGCMNPYDTASHSAWQSSVQQAVIDELSASPVFDTSKVAVTVNSVTEADGLKRVSVQVTYPFKTIINWTFIPSSVDLSQTVVMRGIR